MNNGNRVTAIMAILCVSLVHAGAYMGLTATSDPEMVMMQEGNAASMTMHEFQLAGVTDQTEGNAEDSAMDSEEAPEPQVEEPPKEETPPEPEPEPEPPKPEPEPEPEPKPEPPKEEVVTTKAPSENKVQRQEPKAERKPERRKERQQPRKQASDSNARAVQTAKAVYSESEVSVLSKPTPGYPRAARQRRMQGAVDLLVGINESGSAYSVKIARSSGHDILDKAAAKAAHGIRLKPYKVNGVATPIQVKIQYVFKM